MTVRLAYVAAIAVAAVLSGSCATIKSLTGNQLRKATIEIYRDFNNQCHTITTPFFKITRAEKAKWTIRDETGCLALPGAEVELRFDKGAGDPLVDTCTKKGKTKIECNVRADAEFKVYGYTVYIPGSKEDPEIQIEMP